MRSVVAILLIALLSFAFGLYFPWWTIAIASALVVWVLKINPGLAFLTGFLGVFLLWGGIAWFISSGNHHILAHRMSEFLIKKDSPVMLVLLTATIGAIVSGMGGLTGSLARRLIQSSFSRQ